MKTNKPHKTTGYLVYDPELRFTPGGHAVCMLWISATPQDALSIAEAEMMPVDVPIPDHETWALWRDLGEEAAELLKRGDLVTLRGTPKTSEWVDRVTGEKKSRLTYNAIEYWIGGTCMIPACGCTGDEHA
jgi:single-strand DNA-binding protein